MSLIHDQSLVKVQYTMDSVLLERMCKICRWKQERLFEIGDGSQVLCRCLEESGVDESWSKAKVIEMCNKFKSKRGQLTLKKNSSK